MSFVNSSLSEPSSPTATHARVVGTHGHWSVFLSAEKQEWPLVLSGNLRVFRHFESVVNQLKNYGIGAFTVELEESWAPDKELSISANRPRVLKRASSAEAYDTWFRQQVMQSLNDASTPLSAATAQAHMNTFKQKTLTSGATP